MGSFVSALVSIIGVLLKHTVDRQVESRLEAESQRTKVLQWEAEQRLKLEAAIRALQLFSTSSGSPSPAIQRNGALFTLASLGQHELTLTLAADMLPKGELDAETASSLAGQALERGEETIQAQAIMLLNDNASRLITERGCALPECLKNWDGRLSQYVREWAPAVLGKVMASRPRLEWAVAYPYIANDIIAALAIAWVKESDQRLKNDTGAILHSIIKVFPHISKIYHPLMLIDLSQIRPEVATITPHTSFVVDVVDLLDEWANSS